MLREEVNKTYKLYIGGAFPRTESGRYYALKDKKGGLIANICLSSRKDFRNAVTAARGAFGGWSGRNAFNRSQVLYRISEMMEGRKDQFIAELMRLGYTRKSAAEETAEATDLMLYYAGWCDKYQAVFSSVNPVATQHFNFSVPEPTGVVSIIAPEKHGLPGLVAVVTPVILSGNTCVVLASHSLPTVAVTFAEVLHTSDLPAGVVNILTGTRKELLEHMASHMDVNALVCCSGDKTELKAAAELCSLNVKRFFDRTQNSPGKANPYLILDTTEIKTTWHPVENIGSAKAGY